MKKTGRFILNTVLTFTFLFTLAAACAQEANPATTPEPCPSEKSEKYDAICARMAQGDVDLLWVGDSITFRFEHNAGAKIFAERYGNRKSLNIAIGGFRTGHILWELENAPVDKISPKMAVVMIGTNNIGHGYSTPVQTVEGIEKIINRLKELYPAMKILLLDVFPRDPKPNDKHRCQVNEINQLLEPIYGENKVENVQLYNINDLFLTESGELTKEMMPDFLHPSEAAYEIFGKAIEPMIMEGLDEHPMEAVGEAGSDSWMARFNEKNELLKKNERDYQILLLGDSITHYWEKSVFDEEDLLIPIWKRYYEDLGGINLGIAGDQTQNLVWRVENYDFSNVHPKLAIVLIGVNNIPTGHPYEATAFGTRHIVKTIQQKCPGISVIVLKCLPYKWQGKEEFQRMVDEYNEILPFYFRDMPEVDLIDIGDMYRGFDGQVNLNFFPDRVHPNRDGYLLWGERLKGIVKEKLESAK